MLKSAGLPLPFSVFAHGFVAAGDGRKMSKSLGNVVDPHEICDQYPVDTFRWYMCRDAIYGCDLSFSQTALVLVHNAELCDTLGNLVHRSLTLMEKYNQGVVPERQAGFDFKPFDVSATRKGVHEAMSAFMLQDACAIAIAALRDTNKFLQDEEPWKLKGDEHAPRRLEVVRICLEAVYSVIHLLAAFLPTAATRVFEKLGTPPIPIRDLRSDFQNIPPGNRLTTGSILFKKLDLPEVEKNPAPATGGGGDGAGAGETGTGGEKGKGKVGGGNGEGENGSGKGGGKEGADPDDQDNFTRIDIRVGRITKVWNHEGADRLFCEEIDIGEKDGPRTIASGLREHYTLEEMSDSLVLVVCNLKAAKLAGFMSNGMVLCASGADGKVELVRPPLGSMIGERARVDGLNGEPLKPAQVKKKKAFEALAPDLRTNASRVAAFQGRPIITSAGVCTSDTLADAPIK
ncbi:unnamed protein product [Discosporangium mesarthrocarpum]